MAAANKTGKMTNYVNYRMRATLNDGRQLAGQMLAFDRHMNLVLADTEEFRLKRKSHRAAQGTDSSEQEEKRTLGLIIVRGKHIVSLSVDGPPPADPSARLGTSAPGVPATATMGTGPGISRPAGRGGPPSLAGPAAGVGGPAPPGFPPQGGFPGAPGFGRGGPGGPGFPPAFPGAPPGFVQPPGFQPPPGQGRGGFHGPPGFGGR